MKRKKFRAIIIVFLVVFMLSTCSIAFADDNDYFPWTWGVNTTDLTVQDFTSNFNARITSSVYDWNQIASNINVDSCSRDQYNNDLGKDIRYYQAALTGTIMGQASVQNYF